MILPARCDFFSPFLVLSIFLRLPFVAIMHFPLRVTLRFVPLVRVARPLCCMLLMVLLHVVCNLFVPVWRVCAKRIARFRVCDTIHIAIWRHLSVQPGHRAL